MDDTEAHGDDETDDSTSMPDLETAIRSVAGSLFFANLDMCHAYWQLMLHILSRECMSIQTPIGVFTPTRVLQGSTDAGNHFQSVTSHVFSSIPNLLQWLDDFLLHAQSEDELLGFIESFFGLCMQFGFKLHAAKCKFFLREAKFCGRLIDSAGIRFHPRDMDALQNMRRPEFAADLQQFLCATNWMRSSIPEYSKLIAPSHALLESCYSTAWSRKKRAIRNISLHETWGPDHDAAFQ